MIGKHQNLNMTARKQIYKIGYRSGLFVFVATMYISTTGNRLLIYNSIGLLVREEIIHSQTTIINRNNLSNGIYIYQVVDQFGQYTSGKFIIE